MHPFKWAICTVICLKDYKMNYNNQKNEWMDETVFMLCQRHPMFFGGVLQIFTWLALKLAASSVNAGRYHLVLPQEAIAVAASMF